MIYSGTKHSSGDVRAKQDDLLSSSSLRHMIERLRGEFSTRVPPHAAINRVSVASGSGNVPEN